MALNDTISYIRVEDCTLYNIVTNTIIIGLLGPFGLIGNILAFVTFGRIAKQNAFTVLFRALAIADTLLLLSFMSYYVPVAIESYISVQVVTESYTNSSFPLLHKAHIYAKRHAFPAALTAQAITVWISVLLAINRHTAICKPLKAPSLCTVSNARKQLCSVLGLSLVLMSPRFVETFIKIENNEEDLHYRPWAQQSWYPYLSWTVFMLFFYIIPFGVILILGIKAIIALRSTKGEPIRRHTQNDKSDNHVTRLVLVIILVFLICQTPALVNTILGIILSDDSNVCGRFRFYFYKIANIFVILNSSINCVIHIVFNRTFRETLRPKSSTIYKTKISDILKHRVKSSGALMAVCDGQIVESRLWIMMTSWHRHTFRIIDHLWREFTGRFT